MTEGSIPAWAQDTTRASGAEQPISVAAAFETRTTAAAPSLRPEAFPAVTVPVPSLTNAGLSFPSVSGVVPCLGNSSVDTTTGAVMKLKVNNSHKILSKFLTHLS